MHEAIIDVADQISVTVGVQLGGLARRSVEPLGSPGCIFFGGEAPRLSTAGPTVAEPGVGCRRTRFLG